MKAYYRVHGPKLQIQFDSGPPVSYRTSLKNARWSWNPLDGCWRNIYSWDNFIFARKMCNAQLSSGTKQNIDNG